MTQFCEFNTFDQMKQLLGFFSYPQTFFLCNLLLLVVVVVIVVVVEVWSRMMLSRSKKLSISYLLKDFPDCSFFSIASTKHFYRLAD